MFSTIPMSWTLFFNVHLGEISSKTKQELNIQKRPQRNSWNKNTPKPMGPWHFPNWWESLGWFCKTLHPEFPKQNSKRSQTWFSTLERYMILQHPTPRKFNSEFFSLKNHGWKDFCFPFGMVYFQGRHVKLQVGKQKHATGWWFQPIWKIWVNMGNLPQIGMKIKSVSNHQLGKFQVNFPWNDGKEGHPWFGRSTGLPGFFRLSFFLG